MNGTLVNGRGCDKEDNVVAPYRRSLLDFYAYINLFSAVPDAERTRIK